MKRKDNNKLLKFKPSNSFQTFHVYLPVYLHVYLINDTVSLFCFVSVLFSYLLIFTSWSLEIFIWFWPERSLFSLDWVSLPFVVVVVVWDKENSHTFVAILPPLFPVDVVACCCLLSVPSSSPREGNESLLSMIDQLNHSSFCPAWICASVG